MVVLTSDPPWEVAPLILDFKIFVTSLDVNFSYVKRSASKVADYIAKSVNRFVWQGCGVSS